MSHTTRSHRSATSAPTTSLRWSFSTAVHHRSSPATVAGRSSSTGLFWTSPTSQASGRYRKGTVSDSRKNHSGTVVQRSSSRPGSRRPSASAIAAGARGVTETVGTDEPGDARHGRDSIEPRSEGLGTKIASVRISCCSHGGPCHEHGIPAPVPAGPGRHAAAGPRPGRRRRRRAARRGAAGDRRRHRFVGGRRPGLPPRHPLRSLRRRGAARPRAGAAARVAALARVRRSRPGRDSARRAAPLRRDAGGLHGLVRLRSGCFARARRRGLRDPRPAEDGANPGLAAVRPAGDSSGVWHWRLVAPVEARAELAVAPQRPRTEERPRGVAVFAATPPD